MNKTIAEQLLEQIKDDTMKIEQHSYCSNEFNSDAWYVVDGVVLDFGNEDNDTINDMDKIINAIITHKKQNAIRFVKDENRSNDIYNIYTCVINEENNGE
jgi:hypothetical protein